MYFSTPRHKLTFCSGELFFCVLVENKGIHYSALFSATEELPRRDREREPCPPLLSPAPSASRPFYAAVKMACTNCVSHAGGHLFSARYGSCISSPGKCLMFFLAVSFCFVFIFLLSLGLFTFKCCDLNSAFIWPFHQNGQVRKCNHRPTRGRESGGCVCWGEWLLAN